MPERTPPPEIRADGLRLDLGGLPVLAGVDLRVAPGEMVALVGPSGCGKSTLLAVLAGLLEPDAGSVLLDGALDPGRLGRLTLMPQHDALLPWRTLLDNACVGLRLGGVPREEAERAARRTLARLGLSGFEDHYPHALSGGMRQRAALARTLLGGARAWLLDEPFGALDAITREAMNLELERVWRSRPCTFVMVTHSITEAVFLADRVVSMTARPGRVAGITSVPFERPRPIELHHTSEFQDIVRGVRRLLAEAF